MRTAAILPVKRFAAAKQRLAASVPDALRLELARAMVGDVLAALADARAIELTVIVTGQHDLADGAHAGRVEVLEDRAERGQSSAVSLGVALARERGFERVLCVPGDCPALSPDELDELLARNDEQVVIVPDRHGSGTNALLLSPVDAIPPSFGPDSRARHCKLARAAGRSWRLAPVPSLLLDIDTGADLQELRDRLAASVGRARRTRAVLERQAAPAGGRKG